MNLRQKAKRYKQLYTALSKQPCKPIKFPVQENHIVRLKAKQTIASDVLTSMSAEVETPLGVAGKVLARNMTEEVMKYAKCTIEPSEIPYHVNLVAEVTVVDMRGSENGV